MSLFPGETQADFEESCEFLKKIGFLKVHVFPYSRRSGTPAYDFPDQIHEREKQERSRRMNAMVTTSLMMNRDASPMKAMSASQANAGTDSLTVSWTIFPTNTGSPAQGKTPSVTAPSPFSSLSRERSLM